MPVRVRGAPGPRAGAHPTKIGRVQTRYTNVPAAGAATTITPVPTTGITAPILDSSLAVELRVDATSAGFAGFSTSGSGTAGTGADDTGAGSISWSNPTNAQGVADGSGATASLGTTGTASDSQGNNAAGQVTDYQNAPIFWTATSGYSFQSALANTSSGQVSANLNGGTDSDTLQLDTFGFSIPSDATITGIQVQVNGSSGGVRDKVIQIYSYDTGGTGANKSINTNLPGSASTRTYGGSSDTWGRSWTPAEINSSGFALFLQYHNDGGLSHLVTLEWAAVAVWYTTPTYSYEDSHYLKLSNFGFALPSTATVTGIQAIVTRRDQAGGGVADLRVRLLKGGSIQSPDKAVAGNWPTSYGTRTYGGAGDLWSGSWLYTDINSSGFGFVIQARGGGTSATDGVADVDSVTLVVYYNVEGSQVAITGAPPVRFSPDEADAGRVVLSTSFETEVPGGFSAANLTLSRPEFFNPLDYIYGSARTYEYETDRTLHEGRVVGLTDDGLTITFEVEGFAKHLEDNKTARVIFMDRDFGNWQGNSVQHRVSNPTIQFLDGQVQPDPVSGSPALALEYDGEAWAGRIAGVESWYDAQGLVIAAIDYAWKQTNLGTHAQWSWKVAAGTDDNYTSEDVTGDLWAAGPGSGTLTTTGGNKKFGRVGLTWFNSAAGPGNLTFDVWFTLLGIIGNHGLTIRGTLAAPNTGRGLYASDMITYALDTFAPLIDFSLTSGEVEASTAFVVPHAVFREPTTALDMIESLVLFGNGPLPMDWWISERLNPADPASAPRFHLQTPRLPYTYDEWVMIDGPSLYWTLGNVNGLADQSGNGRNGTAQGGVTIGGTSGALEQVTDGSTDFDGSNDAVTSTYLPFTNGTVRTFTGWAKRDTSTTWDVLFGSQTTGTAADAVFLGMNSGTNDVSWDPNSTDVSSNWAGAWPGNGIWTHWALIFDESANTAELFINGVSQGVKTQTAQYHANAGVFEVGTDFTLASAVDWFDGQISRVAVFERALTANEIMTLYLTGAYGPTKLWRTRYDDGAEASSSGPDVGALLNGVMVRYDDGTGTMKTVGPPASGADAETSLLVDITDSNPANRDGAKHWELFEAGITHQPGAIRIGQSILADRAAGWKDWRGDIRVKRQARDRSGTWSPAAMIRAGDYVTIEDDDDTRPRRIVNTNYDSESRTVSCSIGAQPDRMDSLLAKLGVVLVGKL